MCTSRVDVEYEHVEYILSFRSLRVQTRVIVHVTDR